MSRFLLSLEVCPYKTINLLAWLTFNTVSIPCICHTFVLLACSHNPCIPKFANSLILTCVSFLKMTISLVELTMTITPADADEGQTGDSITIKLGV